MANALTVLNSFKGLEFLPFRNLSSPILCPSHLTPQKYFLMSYDSIA